MTRREHLHRLIDELPEDVVGAVQLFMEFVLFRRQRSDLTDPVLRTFMNAPADDEPLTAEDIAAIAEARADFTNGDTVSWETYMRKRREEG
jgi:hypothetical protein